MEIMNFKGRLSILLHMVGRKMMISEGLLAICCNLKQKYLDILILLLDDILIN
jgi:hypothetical protein